MSDSIPEASLDERIWLTVAAIPSGRIATYGDIAARAGLPGGARRVGAALRRLPAGSGIPWYRVVNARGTSSLPEGSGGARRQQQLLADEGVSLELPLSQLFPRHRW